ncbi:MAG: formyltetrahydrofolate deformylase [Acidobacteria bacterium]|nr:formyltetrahydrofolate deformylase [Acidobacteriota bacterium]
MTPSSAVLLILCPDRTGLVARVSTLLFDHGANILHADQHQDSEAGLFFMRVEWALDGFDLDRFQAAFTGLAASLEMTWRLESSRQPLRVAILVSSHLHCLADLLFRHDAGELACEITSVISNHPDAGDLAGFHGLAFHHIPASAGNRDEVEARQLALLEAQRVDLVVMARYMRVLSADFVARYPSRIINVHHSFLPAFVGARPYHQAFERGVKLIGATSHYATATLDDGPIIEQDVMRISHRDHVPDLIEKGRDLERVVLSRAVKWHLDHRILRYGDKTVVFD